MDVNTCYRTSGGLINLDTLYRVFLLLLNYDSKTVILIVFSFSSFNFLKETKCKL